MQEYPWPGNIRELRNVIERVVLLSRARRPEIRAQDLPLSRRASMSRASVGSATTLAELERQHIEAVLSQTNWHQGNAAKIARHLVEDAVPEDSRVRFRGRKARRATNEWSAEAIVATAAAERQSDRRSSDATRRDA